MNLNLDKHNLHFLTSNPVKATAFTYWGFNVKEFHVDIPEVSSPLVEEVALHKARDTGLNNIIVEDTALYIKDCEYNGTDIKHVYHELLTNTKYDNHPTKWTVCLCLKTEDHFLIAQSSLHGYMKYPAIEQGYHFEKFFAIHYDNKLTHFGEIDEKTRFILSPRYKALEILNHAIETNDFSELLIIPNKNVKDWKGEYQIEKPANVKKNKLNI
jgi:inosine/xanthosine triphosphate pyrophosphatase family protein